MVIDQTRQRFIARLERNWTRLNTGLRRGLAVVYLLSLAAAEFTTIFVNASLGLLMHGVLLVVLVIHVTTAFDHPIHRLLMALIFPSVIRLLNLTLPLADFEAIWRYALVGVPVLAAAYTAVRQLKLPRQQIGLIRGKRWHLQALAIAAGPVIGYLEYQVLRPAPLISASTWTALIVPALILLIFTGFAEELIFRGILQRTAIDVLGYPGLLYTATVFALMHIGSGSALNVMIVFLAGGFFGWVVYRTRSLWGVTLSHGLINITLFLVMPMMAG